MRGSLASILVCAIGMGCGEGETDGVSIKCGVGTLINANENGCEPNLADGVSLNSDGQLVPASVGDGGGVRVASAFSAAVLNSFSEQLLLRVFVVSAVADKLRFDLFLLFRIFVAPSGYKIQYLFVIKKVY